MRKSRKSGKIVQVLNKIRLVKELKREKEKPITKKKVEEFILSHEDKYRTVMEFDKDGLKEVTVIYEIEVNGQWIMVRMYDNTHSKKYLHKHTRTSIQDSREIVDAISVIRKGEPSDWLSWARRDIINSWFFYRRALLRRSQLVDKR